MPSPGGRPVGRLDALPPLPGLAVRALRRWCDEGPMALARDLAGPEAADAFDALCRHCLAACRRPLMRHGAGCPCLGADEAVFARLVELAAEGAREEALWIACALVRPEAALSLLALAEQAGLALARALVPPARLH